MSFGSSTPSITRAFSTTSSVSSSIGGSRSFGSPQPCLLTDANHRPRTHGSVGILLVGIGGANGATLLAGVLANRNNLEWRGPRGERMTANYYGCITQLKPKGVHGGVGYRGKVKGLADASMAAVGGWDIRSEKLGDALLSAQILDYDLARQVKDEMNRVKVFRGYYNPDYIGCSQHATATHVLTEKEAGTASDAIKAIRADIRYFKWRNGVVGHTTVIWSASVEPNCEFSGLQTARGLLESIEMTDKKRGGALPPSLIYATAAILEGCSFVNGGSQNTLCGGLMELARQSLGVYCLGTDFKAGQTKFKTAAVEYLRTMGLTPKVIASSNHLGNNDMRNLATADKARMAKLRVKHDIFAPWEEDIDHKVSVMFTPMINDEKRDFVEYTSQGFLGQTHTMVTYTRASDSVLCVPLMIDAAVWCDLFSHRSWPYDYVAKALAYLFKVPEGAAKGVDPGFFRQMEELNSQALAACQAGMTKNYGQKRKVRIRPEDKQTEWAILNGACIICAGLACVDMQLNRASGGNGGESIESFQGEISTGGGSVSMSCKNLARLCHGAPLDEDYMSVTPPVLDSIIPLCKIGYDSTGDKLISLLESTGASRNVVTKYIKNARKRDPNSRTALAVLPIYQDGRRGCFFDAAGNATFTKHDLAAMIDDFVNGSQGPKLDTTQLTREEVENYEKTRDRKAPNIGAFLFGYPHLLPEMQGENLACIFRNARGSMEEGGITLLDLNGVAEKEWKQMRTVADLQEDPVLGPVLSHVDILHLNEEELIHLTGCQIQGREDTLFDDEFEISGAVNLLLMCGVAVVAVTRGRKGCLIACNDEDRFMRSKMLPTSWIDCTTKLGAVELPSNTVLNTNGAGDAFTSGLLVAAMLRHTGMTVHMRSEKENNSGSDEPEPEPETASVLSELDKLPGTNSARKTVTPYSLYMREHYMTLKAQCEDDKKAIFTKCHNLWENESPEIKAMYERKCNEELEDDKPPRAELDLLNLLEPESTLRQSSYESMEDENRNLYLANRALNLESAAQFASLVAAFHIDVGTRDADHLDMCMLLERAMIFPHGLEEI